MNPTLQELGVDRLGTDDRLTLAEAIWEGVAREIEQAPLPETRREELARRLADSIPRPDAVVGKQSRTGELLVETVTMGRVLTEATVENLKDLRDVERGLRPADEARRVMIPDAFVDTGATLLSMPTSLIRRLGLLQTSTKRVTTSAGITQTGLYEAIRLTIQGRSCTMDVLEVHDDVPVLIGQLPPEHLDLVVDLRNRQLIGNPAHGGEHMSELY